MSDKSVLCLWCGRFTTAKAEDGLADCDRLECIAKRRYKDDFDRAGGVKVVPSTWILAPTNQKR